MSSKKITYKTALEDVLAGRNYLQKGEKYDSS